MKNVRNVVLYGVFGFSVMTFGISLILLVTLAERLNQLDSMTADLAATPSASPVTPPTTSALWSLPYPNDLSKELVAVYPISTMWDHPGSPSLRFSDLDSDNPTSNRSFEIGFYRYGPTWYSPHFITEFWLGDGDGGILSVAGNNQGGGELQVRNPTDTDAIHINYFTPEHPTISTEHGTALYFQATNGLVSETHHSFMDGISIASGSGYSGVSDSAWNSDKITVTTSAVRDDSFVNVMPISEPKGRWWVCEIVTAQAFTLCSSAPDESMNFHWLVIGGS